ncbi:MAG: L,D-transpeptidase family protein [Gammaproteobacteria bacterium]|nr:L,D-transpeptidase family protein [Gammaproteobacteria bacterium]
MLAPSLTVADDGSVREAIRERIGTLVATDRVDVEGVTLGSEDILAGYYAGRDHAPAWTDPDRAAALQGLLAAAATHGLDPEDFFLSKLEALAASATAPAALADLDLLRTEALIRYGYQRRFGKVDPGSMEPAWNFRRGFAAGEDPVALLAAAIEAPVLEAVLDSKMPGGPWYRQLQAALARYRAIAAGGGWPAVPDGAVLKPGQADPRVIALRERLQAEGDAVGSPAADDPEVFDAPLAAAVRGFQGRHGLAVDAEVGPATLRELNVPTAVRVDQLRLSLERVRWLAGDVPSTYVVVNVAGFHVGYVREQRLVWQSRVVVGREARQTPIFRGLMTYVELNPTWTIPPTILREDILPKLRRDPGYLRRERITVLDRAGQVVDPLTVDWSAYRRGVPYTLRQEPGPANALGRIKLMFPNPHAVYLHDTPARELFTRPKRTFSSGCIRVEDPLGLAELVLDDARWDRAALEAGIATGRTQRVSLRTPVPVLLVYLTAVVDPDGVVRFSRDVYGRDPALQAALDGPVRLVFPTRAAGGKVRPVPL